MHQAPRGTADIMPEHQGMWSWVTQTVTRCAQIYGYGRIDTPIFEDKGLFARVVGTETDIVQKEMYLFEDRGGQSLTLRPEGTAAVCRAYLEHGMHNTPQPTRLFYISPMFRYDRPQAGRYRQFHQVGAEAIGDGNAAVDLEIIQLALAMVHGIGLQNIRLVLNNIGDSSDRPAYAEALQEYFSPHVSNMNPDDRRRLATKELAGESFMESAPRTTDFLGSEAQSHWDELLALLESADIDYKLDHKLVRGLDYYTRTVFELHPEAYGAQSAVCAGGRYDGLIEQLGGLPTPGIGFAAGIERLLLNLESQGASTSPGPKPAVIAFLGQSAKQKAVQIAADLHEAGICAVVAPDRSLKAQMRYASAIGATHAVLLGSEEISNGTATLKDLQSGAQTTAPATELRQKLSSLEIQREL